MARNERTLGLIVFLPRLRRRWLAAKRPDGRGTAALPYRIYAINRTPAPLWPCLARAVARFWRPSLEDLRVARATRHVRHSTLIAEENRLLAGLPLALLLSLGLWAAIAAAVLR